MRAIQLGLVAVASTTIIAGVIISLWLLGSASGQRDKFSSLRIAPRDAAVYVALNTDPTSSQWLAVSDTLGTLHAKDPIREAIDEALAKFDLQFERDILPLAGDEAYFAITDLDALSDEGGFVVAVQLRNPGRAKEIFLDVSEEEGDEYSEERYEGETIYQSEASTLNADDETSLSIAGDVLAIATYPQDVKAVIDVIQGRAPSAEDNERLQELRRRKTDDFLTWGYVDMAQVWAKLDEQFEELEASQGFDAKALVEDARGGADRLTFALSATGDGFTIDASVVSMPGYTPKFGTQYGTVFDAHYPQRVPADTLAFMAGYDLYNQTYLPFRDALGGAPSASEGESIDDTIQQFEDEIGFDFEDDLLSLLTREYAIAIDASDFSGDVPKFSVLALFDVDDASTIERTLGRAGDYFAEQELFTVEDGNREGVRRWGDLGGSGESIAWTTSGESLVFGYPEKSVNTFLEGGDSLADTADWQRTMELLPNAKTAVLYVSLARLLEEISKVEDAAAQFEEATDGKVTFDDLAPIRALGMASTREGDGYGLRLVVLIKE